MQPLLTREIPVEPIVGRGARRSRFSTIGRREWFTGGRTGLGRRLIQCFADFIVQEIVKLVAQLAEFGGGHEASIARMLFVYGNNLFDSPGTRAEYGDSIGEKDGLHQAVRH